MIAAVRSRSSSFVLFQRTASTVVRDGRRQANKTKVQDISNRVLCHIEIAEVRKTDEGQPLCNLQSHSKCTRAIAWQADRPGAVSLLEGTETVCEDASMDRRGLRPPLTAINARSPRLTIHSCRFCIKQIAAAKPGRPFAPFARRSQATLPLARNSAKLHVTYPAPAGLFLILWIPPGLSQSK